MQFLAVAIFFTLSSSVKGAARCKGGKLEAAFIDEILTKVNKIRSDIVQGKVSPPGKTMNQVYWSCDLEKKALELKRDCEHTEADHDIEESLMNDLFKDYMDYDELSIAGDQVKYLGPEKEYEGSVANLANANMTEIGCAFEFCFTGNYINWVTSAGAMKNGDTIYEMGSGKCESCSPGTSCDSTTQLCARDTKTKPDYPTGSNSKCPENVGMTDELRTNFLDMHNYRRILLANGEVAKNTGNLLPKGVDCDLEADVIAYAGTCPDGVPKGVRQNVGEHYHRVSVSNAATYRDAIKSAVTNWWKVVRLYPGPGMEVTFRAKHIGQPIETFTQMAWAETTKLGCSVVKCLSNYVIICRYSPKGNIIEHKLYIPGPPCSMCSGRCYRDQGLCSA